MNQNNRKKSHAIVLVQTTSVWIGAKTMDTKMVATVMDFILLTPVIAIHKKKLHTFSDTSFGDTSFNENRQLFLANIFTKNQNI